jgi:hypothetical protein
MNFKLTKSIKRPSTSKSYFDEDDDDDLLQYSSNTTNQTSLNEDEVDPLDAFMEQNEKAIISAPIVSNAYVPEIVSEQDRDYESYYEALDNEKKAVFIYEL